MTVPPASALGLGDALVFRFAASHLAGDQAQVADLLRAGDDDGYARLLDERGATEAWQRFRSDETKAALRRWCDEHGLQATE